MTLTHKSNKYSNSSPKNSMNLEHKAKQRDCCSLLNYTCIMRQLLIDVLHTPQLLEVLAPQLFTEM